MADVNLRITDRAGEVRTISAHAGDMLMQVLRDQIDLTLGTCGGEISCGTCLVRRRASSIAALRPTKISHAAGSRGGPFCGQVFRARRQASWNASSARSRSRK